MLRRGAVGSMLLAAPSATPTCGRGLRALVVEDSEDGRELLVALLRLWGHDTCEAEDGETGLALCVEMRPDVALIDVGLPGIDGYELARRIRATEDSRHVFLVAVTGYAQPADQRRALEAGFDAHLVKPVDPGVLRRLLTTRAPG